MRTTVFVAVVALVASCSKTEKTAPAKQPEPKAVEQKAPHVQEGELAAKFDPKNLPAPGTAPAPVVITKELDPMWNVSLKTLKGQPAKLADFKGKALLVVNVASECGLTPQYATLEAVQKKYEAKGFTVVGFPCNQFGGQEPGTSEQIAEFCASNYGITFPMMEKSDVNGPARNDVYKALTPIADASGHSGDIRWNFEKFVISADGTKVTRFSPRTQPDDPTVIAAIESSLPK